MLIFSHWLELVFAVLGCLLLKYSITRFQASQAFTIIRFRGQFLLNWESGLTVFALVLGLLSALTVLMSDLWPIAVAACLLVCSLLRAYLYPSLDFREHGLAVGHTFVPWNAIATYDWSSTGSQFTTLTIYGPWFFPKQFKVSNDRRADVDGLIAGASRFEKPPASLRWIRTAYWLIVWTIVAIALGWMMHLLLR